MKSRKLYINGRFLMSKPTGIQWYSYEICRALLQKGIAVRIVCPASGKPNEAFDVSGMDIVRFGFGTSHFWEQFVLPLFFLFKRRYLLLCLSGLGPVAIGQKITTIHDLSFLVNPSWFSRRYRLFYKIMTPLMIRTSRWILTVSRFSKSEILRFYPFLQEKKITIVYNAVKENQFAGKATDKAESAQAPYFLVVASLDPRKNIAVAIEAMKGMKDCTLKIAGEANRVFSATYTTETEGVEFIGRKSLAELSVLYSGAAALLFPSFYEGFGRPAIEAMQARCLVLASDIPSFREVCGDAAIYFDPNDTADVRRAMQRALELSAVEKEALLEKGMANVGRFSWEKSADEIINLLNSLSE